jgi:hypothetical protein
MVVYVKDSKGHLRTIQEIAYKYQVPTSLVYSRYQKGYRDIEKLIQPKHEMLRK